MNHPEDRGPREQGPRIRARRTTLRGEQGPRGAARCVAQSGSRTLRSQKTKRPGSLCSDPGLVRLGGGRSLIQTSPPRCRVRGIGTWVLFQVKRARARATARVTAGRRDALTRFNAASMRMPQRREPAIAPAMPPACAATHAGTHGSRWWRVLVSTRGSFRKSFEEGRMINMRLSIRQPPTVRD